jgi:hypothetical protein
VVVFRGGGVSVSDCVYVYEMVVARIIKKGASLRAAAARRVEFSAPLLHHIFLLFVVFFL